MSEPVEKSDNQKQSFETKEHLIEFKHNFRNSLPKYMVDRSTSSVWAILKQCVDKELYRFTLPIIWNEPLSLLQRAAENARFADDLLDKASKMTDAIDRMKYVAAFLISSTSVHVHRLSKPFNPLLGETYEFFCNEKNFRMVCEQVSHHPPISAYYAESIRPSKVENKVRWKYYGSVNPFMKINFLHACVEAYPEGIQTVELPEHGEIYTWHNAKVTAHNIVLGKMWFENTGKVEIVNHKLNLRCVMEFKPYSWFSKQFNKVEGFIVDDNGTKVSLINGKWDEFLYATNNLAKSKEFFKLTETIQQEKNSLTKSSSIASFKDQPIELLWKGENIETLFPEYYNFSPFTLRLNEIFPALEKPNAISIKENNLIKTVSIGPIAPTDARYRPDLRYFDNGDLDVATEEKHRLEEKQREKRAKNAQFEKNWKPLWFNKSTHEAVPEEETYAFNHKYWDRDFTSCPELY